MKKFFIIIGFVVVLLIALLFIGWASKTWFAAHWLAKELGVPVSIEKVVIGTKQASVKKLHIGNHPQAKTDTAFSTDFIEVDSRLSQIFGDPLVINRIAITNPFVGIEFYDTNGETNWSRILAYQKKDKKKKKEKNYLIKELILTNLKVSVTDINGKTKTFPVLASLKLTNISNETGFPIEEIEKAIFNAVLKSIIQKYSIDMLFDNINPKTWIQRVLPFAPRKTPTQP